MEKIDIMQYGIYFVIGILMAVFLFCHGAFYKFPPVFAECYPINWMATIVGGILAVIFFAVIESVMEMDDRHWLKRKLKK